MKFLTLIFLALLISCGSGGSSSTNNEIWTLQGTFNNFPVSISASRDFGGAIYSLRWNNFEFINSDDHGRELQTAWQLDYLGEDENPTEAGSALDKVASSTIIKTAAVDERTLTTSAWLAYWYPYKGQVTSYHTLSKTVTLGYKQFSNIIHHEISISLADDHVYMGVEGLTGYLPKLFTRWFIFDPVTKIRTEVFGITTMTISSLPVIASNQDGSYAISLYHLANFYNMSYVYGVISSWPKLDCAWFGINNPKAVTYSWEAFTIFGTLEDVTSTLSQLTGG